MSDRKKRFAVKIEADECKGCERCILACPKSVLKMSESGLNIYGFPYAQYVGAGCIGCGACFYGCPEPGAIIVLEETES